MAHRVPEYIIKLNFNAANSEFPLLGKGVGVRPYGFIIILNLKTANSEFPLFGSGVGVRPNPMMKSSFIKLIQLLFFTCLFAHLHICASAQDSSRLRISLLTCSPGEELYATFGHSAYRVIDSTSLTDIVYNYGTFNFGEDGFYLKFMRGKLLYYVSTEYFKEFAYGYRSEGRGIIEQVLDLSAAEKVSIRNFLNENLKPENRYYKYDFFFDNCTTRLRDILKKQHDSTFIFRSVMPPGSRFRQAIHEYLDRNGEVWSKLGIDILLGLPCDAVMTPEQMQFLPDNLMKSLDSGNGSHRLVLSRQEVCHATVSYQKDPFFTPLVIFSLLLTSIVVLSLVRKRFTHAFLQGFDGILFFLTGILGIIVVLMWTVTDHSMCRNNLNLLWAWPTHFIMAFLINSKKRWVKWYFLINTTTMAIMLLAWFFLPQQMNNGLLPLVGLLMYRSWVKWWEGKRV